MLQCALVKADLRPFYLLPHQPSGKDLNYANDSSLSLGLTLCCPGARKFLSLDPFHLHSPFEAHNGFVVTITCK